MIIHGKDNSVKLPTDAVFAITYKCNSRCVMCDIWRIREHHDVPAEVYLKVPKTLRNVNISGGEPFLNPDIVHIIRNIKHVCPRAKLIISSNGFLPEMIAKKAQAILRIDPNIGVAISIDGMEEMQEKIRGIPGGFQKNLETLRLLKSINVRHLRIAFTVTSQNIDHFSQVYELSRKLNVEFTCAIAQSSDFYFGGKQNPRVSYLDFLEREFDFVMRRELRSWSLKRHARAYFIEGLKRFARNGNSVLPSEAGFEHFFMDPKGDVYPSVVHNRILGNLFEQNFEDLWYSKEAEAAREYVKRGEKAVWMICTARSAIKKHPFKAFFWWLTAQWRHG
jgi:MoaA/NifB/PqqE/SkfB family radical SAM enzyme